MPCCMQFQIHGLFSRRELESEFETGESAGDEGQRAGYQACLHSRPLQGFCHSLLREFKYSDQPPHHEIICVHK